KRRRYCTPQTILRHHRKCRRVLKHRHWSPIASEHLALHVQLDHQLINDVHSCSIFSPIESLLHSDLYSSIPTPLLLKSSRASSSSLFCTHVPKMMTSHGYVALMSHLVAAVWLSILRNRCLHPSCLPRC